MRTRRFGWLGGVGAVLPLVGLLACEQSPTPVQEAPKLATAAAFTNAASRAGPTVLAGQSIGDIHDEAMDAVFHALVRANRTGRLSPQAGCRVARAAVMQFFQQKGVLHGSYQQVVDDGFLNAGCRGGQGGEGSVVSSYEYTTTPEAIANSGLSETAKYYLYQINNAVESGYSTASIQSQIWSIEQQAASVLNTTEREIVTATASVAANSIEYWDQNFETWYYENGGGGGGGTGPGGELVYITSNGAGDVRILGFWSSVKRVAAGDVGGAVAGAVAGSFAGGVGAGPGALAGAAGGSAGAATLELLNAI